MSKKITPLTIKGDSLPGFIAQVSFNPIPVREGYEMSMGRGLVSEIHIKTDTGYVIEPGNTVIVELNERGNISGSEVTTKLIYKCEAYDDVSHKLVLQKR